jgi:hypothetical protein
MSKKWIFLLVVVFILLIGERSLNLNPKQFKEAESQTYFQEGRMRVSNGIWNGPTLSMYVSDEGAVLIFSCGNGSIIEPLILDEKNHFNVKGYVTLEDGNLKEVQYSGLVSDTKMILQYDDQMHELIFEGEMILIRCL